MSTGSSLWSRTSDVRYARLDDAHVAYRVIAGEGSADTDVVLLSSGTASMEAWFDDPVGVRLLDGLAELGRLVVFDRRGIGLSDPPATWDGSEIERWVEDLEAVVEAAEVTRPVLVSSAMSWPPAVVYCDRHRGDISGMASLEPTPAIAPPAELIQGQLAGEIDSVALFAPSRADEPGFREWFDRAGRVGASPRLAAHAFPTPSDAERRAIELAMSRLSAPTLVLRRPASAFSPEPADDLIAAIVPGAVRVDLPGEDRFIVGGEVDALLTEITAFVTGERRPPAPECALAAVLFSDIVASTEQASTLGGERWKRVLDRHDSVSRACVTRRGGAIVKTTGDGIVAIFPAAISAVRAAQDLRAALDHEGLTVRVGLHVGDVDQRGDDISGLAVHIAARIMNLAAPGEILASSTFQSIASAAPVEFEARGEHALKGVAQTVALFAVTDETERSQRSTHTDVRGGDGT